MTSGWCSRTAWISCSDGTLMPRFTTSKPLLERMMSTRFLPMSWTSPLTVASSTLPRERPFRLLHVRLEMRHRGLHHLGALQHLGDDQLVVVEQAADLAHAVHQRAVDDVERRRPAVVFERQLQVVIEADLGALDDGARQALVEREVESRRAPTADALRPRKCSVKAATAAVEPVDVAELQVEQRLGELALLVRDLGVARQPLGVDDRRVEPGLGAVVEEDRVEHLAAGGRQAEADVGDAEDGARVRQLAA